MKTLCYISILCLLFSCNNLEKIDMSNFKQVYSNDGLETIDIMSKVAENKIYFGHQSVGYNIIEGIEQLNNESGTQLTINESRDFASAKTSSLVHFTIGENKDPFSKIDDFVLLMNDIEKDSGSIAFFKFCYIDFQKTTDVDTVFEYYKDKMLDLKHQYPNTKIVLFTVPIRALQKGIKAIIKKILFMPVGEVPENMKRNDFNQRMNDELGTEFPIFDLAKIESTLPDGSANTFKYKGNLYPSMPYIYTKDKGHLNSYGARIVAHNLIAFLTTEINN